ncbi:MAG: ABC transporter permease [Bacteroidetes bacterium]|nr:ABC transporter permease [Bacteroidota bacterium]
MRTLLFLLRKEFRQIFRNVTILRMILLMPVMQLLILPNAANFEVKNITVCIVDHDHSVGSQRLVTSITASGYFKLALATPSYRDAMQLIEADKADLILEIPNGFDRNLVRDNKQTLFIAVNAINGVKANLGAAYLNTIITQYNAQLRTQWIQPTRFGPVSQIEISALNKFNPYLNYKVYMVPGIMAFLVTMVAAYLSALNIVKEKESGTIEQINVTPIRKYQFILGKLIPFWVLGLVVFTIGLLVMRFVYGIVPEGSVFLLYGFAVVYIFSVLGMGLLVSTYAETQQQAMFVAFFFIMIFIMLGGLFTSIDSMPAWAQVITRFNPVRYFIEVMRMVVIRGSTFDDIKMHFLAVIGMGIVLNGWAVLNYRKTS